MNVCTRPVTCAQGNSRFAQNSGRGAVARAIPPSFYGPQASDIKEEGRKVREEMTLYAACAGRQQTAVIPAVSLQMSFKS